MEGEVTQAIDQQQEKIKRPLALRQPEVFETPDAEDSGPIVVVVEERDNANIDRTGVTPNKAFARFYDKGFDSAQDFSSTVRRASKQKEFEASKEDLKSLQETPLQRFQRLQSEVRELSEELSAAAEKRTPLEQDIPALEIADEVQQLQVQLEDLIAKEEHRPFLNPNYENEQSSILQANLSKKLISHLEAVGAKDKRKQEDASSDDKGQITYELYYTPALAESAKEGSELSVLSEMDRRMAQLEKLLGANTFMGNLPANDMLSLVESMNDKLSLLNQVELDKVDRKLKMLSLELDDIARSEEKTGLPAHQEKKAPSTVPLYSLVNEVYEMMARADATIQQMPAIIARLQSLRPLHEESLTFSQTLRHLHNQQSQIVHMLSSHNAHLIKVEDGLAENMATIQKNVDALNARIEKVAEKLSSA